MTHHDFGDLFQRSFAGGSYEEYKYLGGNCASFTQLKLDEDTLAIPTAIVVYNQEGYTWIFDGETDVSQSLKPLSKSDYNEWRIIQGLIAEAKKVKNEKLKEELKIKAREISNRRFN